jgi:hypothetical protein
LPREQNWKVLVFFSEEIILEALGNAKLLINRQRNVLLESSFKSLDCVSAEIYRWVLGLPEITSLESVYWEWMELE